MDNFLHRSVSLVIFLISTFHFSLNAQSAVLDSTMWHSKILDIEYIDDNEYVIAKQSYFHGNTKVEWFRNDSIKKSFYIEADLNSLNFTRTEEGVLMDAASFLDCDVIFPRFGSFLLDTVNSESIFLPFYSEFALYFPTITATDDGRIVLLDGQDRFLSIKGPNTEDILFKLPSTDIQSIEETQDHVLAFGGKYVYFYEKGVYNLDSIVFDNQTVQRLTAGNMDSSFYIMTDSAVYEFTYETKQEINRYDLHEGEDKYLDILYSEGLYLLRDSNDQTFFIDKIDGDGKWQTLETIARREYELRKLYDLKENGIWVAGQFTIKERWEDDHSGSSIIYKLDSLENSPNNIGLYNVELSKIGNNSLEIAFEVRNQSDKDLDDIKVYSSIISGAFCSVEYLEYKIRSLAANTDTLIRLEKSVSFLSDQVDLCFYILGSGIDPDLEMDDNINCLLFSSSYEETLKRKNLVYPNPATNEIFVDEFQNYDKVEIYSIDGRLLVQGEYQEGVNISDLSQGIYYLRNKTLPGKSYKFIKQ